MPANLRHMRIIYNKYRAVDSTDILV